MTTRATRFPSAASLAADLPDSLLLGVTANSPQPEGVPGGGDTDLVRELESDFAIFSIAWSRAQPSGSGRLSEMGLSGYDRLIDRLLVDGISPIATLVDGNAVGGGTPDELSGGWLNRDTARRLGDLAFLLGERFGDRVERWVSIDDPAALALGPTPDIRQPGHTPLGDALTRAHTVLLGHGYALEGLRGAGVRGGLGMVQAYSPVEPATSSDDDTQAAWLVDTIQNALFGDAVLLGRYPRVPDHFASLLTQLVEVDDSDLAVIAQPIDFFGFRYSAPTRVGSGRSPASLPQRLAALSELSVGVASWPEFPSTASGSPIAPEYLAIALEQLGERYGELLPPVLLTCSGVDFPEVLVLDERTGDRVVADPRRIDYLATHLEAAITATAEGGPAASVTLLGFSAGALLDECGLVHVDLETGERTAKDSYRWLQWLAGNRSK